MAKTIEVEVDESGTIRLVIPQALPRGRALLVWPEEPFNGLLLSEKAFEDWLSPEEDAAWAYLQPVK